MITTASEETFHDGRIIAEEGSSGDNIFLVKSGSVEISKIIGGNRFVVEILRGGDIFGDVSFVPKVKRLATAKAVGQTTIGLIENEKITSELKKLSVDTRIVFEALIIRLRKMTEAVLEASARSDPRVQKRLPLIFKDKESLNKAYAENVSSGGLLIRTSQLLEKGEKMWVKLHLPGLQDAMKIKCEVAWAGKHMDDARKGSMGMGVRFVEISEEDRGLLKQYIDAVRLISN